MKGTKKSQTKPSHYIIQREARRASYTRHRQKLCITKTCISTVKSGTIKIILVVYVVSNSMVWEIEINLRQLEDNIGN